MVGNFDQLRVSKTNEKPMIPATRTKQNKTKRKHTNWPFLTTNLADFLSLWSRRNWCITSALSLRASALGALAVGCKVDTEGTIGDREGREQSGVSWGDEQGLGSDGGGECSKKVDGEKKGDLAEVDSSQS